MHIDTSDSVNTFTTQCRLGYKICMLLALGDTMPVSIIYIMLLIRSTICYFVVGCGSHNDNCKLVVSSCHELCWIDGVFSCTWCHGWLSCNGHVPSYTELRPVRSAIQVNGILVVCLVFHNGCRASFCG